MRIQFAKINPTENMTILVLSSLPRAQYGSVAERLMAYGSVGGEQVGFVEQPTLPGARARLQMMGGEFCGNASMSLAALLAWKDGLSDGKEAVYPLEVSGAERVVRCHIRRKGASFEGTVSMPLPESVEELELMPGLIVPLVRFKGIVHALLRAGKIEPEVVECNIRHWCAQVGADAFGAMLMDDDGCGMRPLVYVRDTDSCVWERGCGSGSAAVGCWMAVREGCDVRMELKQPGGMMGVFAQWFEGRVSRVEIQGQVKLAAMGEAFVEPDGME